MLPQCSLVDITIFSSLSNYTFNNNNNSFNYNNNNTLISSNILIALCFSDLLLFIIHLLFFIFIIFSFVFYPRVATKSCHSSQLLDLCILIYGVFTILSLLEFCQLAKYWYQYLSYEFFSSILLLISLIYLNKFNICNIVYNKDTKVYLIINISYWFMLFIGFVQKTVILFGINLNFLTYFYGQYSLVSILSLIIIIYFIANKIINGKKGNSSNEKKCSADDYFPSDIKYLHPNSSLLSKATFSWFFDILYLGYHRPIELSDLGSLPKKQLVEYQQNRLNESVEIQIKSKKSLSLWKCYWFTYKYSLAVGAILRIFADISALVGPLSISYILKYVDKYKNSTQLYDASQQIQYLTSDEFYSNGFVIAFLVLCATFLQGTLSNSFNHTAILEGINLRCAIQGLIYKKALKMTTSLGMDVGGIVNYMSSDAFNLMMLFSMGHYVWAVPLKVGILLTLLYFQLGTSALIGAGVIYIFVPIQYFLGKKLFKVQKQAITISDERLRKTNELLLGIKWLKLLGWEMIFCQKVQDIRKNELKMLRKDSILVALITFITQATSIVITLVTFAFYPYMENKSLTPGIVFTGLALFNQLTVPLYILPFVVPIMINAYHSSKRIETFLLSSEIDPYDSISQQTSKAKINYSDFVNQNTTIRDYTYSNTSALQIIHGYFSWNNKIFLKDINIDIPLNKLTVIIGPNASGKTSLLSAITGEITKTDGKIKYFIDTSKIGYLPQNPWLFSTTLRNNITFGSPFDLSRYQQVKSICALQEDVDLLPNGDDSQIGERGINLSGGQKQRISLARALYCQSSLLILDDPLSALDANVSSFIFKQLRLTKDRTIIMVTHDHEHIKKADQIIVMNEGEIIFQGNYNEIQAKNLPIFDNYAKSTALKNSNDSIRSTDRERQKLHRLVSKQKLVRTMSCETSSKSKPIGLLRQVSHDPSPPLPYNGKYELKKSWSILFMPKASLESNMNTTSVYGRPIFKRFDSKISDNTIKEEEEINFKENYDEMSQNSNASYEAFFSEEERETGSISPKVYWIYIKACSKFLAFTVIILMLFSQASKVATDFWLAEWSESKELIGSINNNTNASNQNYLRYYINGYCGLSLFTIIISLVTNLLFQLISLRAVRVLHQRLIISIVNSPIKFFDITPIGRIINRFASDISTIDKKISATLPLLLRFTFLCFSAILLDIIVTPYFAPVAILMICIYGYLQHFFRYTSRELQRLDNISKSPIFSHFNQTLTGLSIIRAFKQQENFTQALYRYINVNNLTLLMVNCSNCWLGIALDYLGGVILFTATIASLLFAKYSNISTSFVGISITYTLLVPIYLNWVVRNLAYLEMYMSAFERIDNYSNLESENAHFSIQEPDHNWPSKGSIDYKNVKLTYHLNHEPILKSITLSIKPGEKIGICGRTGSGKSTLIMGLLRMMDISDGSIYIDDVDITSISCRKIRESIALVPQENVIFSGTLRDNLDPLLKISDENIWNVIRKTNLDKVFTNLEVFISEDGANLSTGQRQLLCLARALLKDSKILIMDEATSSLDIQTEELISDIIINYSATVISIAHHVSCLLKYDTIVVLDSGTIAEKGSPSELINKENGLFKCLLESEKKNNRNYT